MAIIIEVLDVRQKLVALTHCLYLHACYYAGRRIDLGTVKFFTAQDANRDHAVTIVVEAIGIAPGLDIDVDIYYCRASKEYFT